MQVGRVGGVNAIGMPLEAPARSYLGLGQLHDLFRIDGRIAIERIVRVLGAHLLGDQCANPVLEVRGKLERIWRRPDLRQTFVESERIANANSKFAITFHANGRARAYAVEAEQGASRVARGRRSSRVLIANDIEIEIGLRPQLRPPKPGILPGLRFHHCRIDEFTDRGYRNFLRTLPARRCYFFDRVCGQRRARGAGRRASGKRYRYARRAQLDKFSAFDCLFVVFRIRTHERPLYCWYRQSRCE